MRLKIGEKIKTLRKAADITQEELAEMLGVSCQSVSRWELEACYPDMELLPELAEIFHSSVDSLLGIDDTAEKAKVARYLERFQEAINRGAIEECIAVAREGVAEYPNNYTLLNKLMYALFVSGDDSGNIPGWEENKEKYDGEITALGERIAKYCPDQEIRLEATARLAFQHVEMGRKSTGRAIYETLPPKALCRENQIWWGLREEEKLPFIREEIRADYESLRSNIWLLGSSGYLPKEESAAVLEKAAALEELVCDGNQPRNGWGAARLRCDLAKLYAGMGQRELMYRNLREAALAAKEFGGRPQTQSYTSLLLGTVKEDALEFETTDTRPFWELMRDKWLSDAAFDSWREKGEFQEILRSCVETPAAG